MIHVRRHTRQLGSGKTVQVTEYDRSGNAAESAGITRPSGQDDGWWDHPAQAEDVNMGEHPDGTWYFQQGDDTMAVHPDGTVHPVTEEADEPDPAPVGDHPAGTWYFNDHGETYAVYPDGSTHAVPDEPAAPPRRESWDGPAYDEDDGDAQTAQDVPFPQDGSPSHPQAEDCSFTRETPEGTETLPVDPSVPRCTEDRGAWGGDPGRAPVHPASTLGRMHADMRHWRSLPEPQPRPETLSPQMSHAMGCDTPEGKAKYDRLRAYREAGYTGPLDQDNRIPDPDDPANHESLSALARMSEI